ncbi:YrvL family regulatory protein [Paenibacillus albiflavus]|nr:YrvL family regulatory protein [Paenibacillus albiflavus]
MDDQDPLKKDPQKPKIKIIRFGAKNKTVVITSILLILFLLFLLIFGLFFFVQVGIFKLVGVEYTSWSAAIGFLAMFFMFKIAIKIGVFAFKIFSFGLFRNSMANGNPSAKLIGSFTKGLLQPSKSTRFLFALFRIVVDIYVVHMIDEWMPEVNLSNLSEVLLVLVVFLLGQLFSIKRRGVFWIRK